MIAYAFEYPLEWGIYVDMYLNGAHFQLPWTQDREECSSASLWLAGSLHAVAAAGLAFPAAVRSKPLVGLR